MTAAPHPAGLGIRRAVAIFLAFAFAYFLSALLRAVTATLAPVFSAEMGLAAGQLGLLGGAYFLGFALMQLPLGSALDRWGAKRVLMVFLAVAVGGCAAFAASRSLVQLLAARFFIGVGVAACLMAPLTCYRHHYSTAGQLRANSWMLMTGSLGMLASTLPVQWMLPLTGWRGLFAVVAGMLLAAVVLIWRLVPRDAPVVAASGQGDQGYRQVFAHPVFRRVAPLGFFAYGGMIAMQSLWIGPWLTEVVGASATEAARGLFFVNLSMLVAFLGWGLVMPRLIRRGWAGERLIALTWPAGVLCLGWIVWRADESSAALWALWCVLTSAVSLSQPAVGQAFPVALAGRALSAFNLVIFAGVFTLQWGIGLAIDALRAHGLALVPAYQLAFAAYGVACALSFAWLVGLRWRADRASAHP